MSDLSRRVAQRYLDRVAVAPPGWEDTVKEMKKDPEIDNPWALAWSMKNKGYEPGGSDKEASSSYTKAYYTVVEALRELRDHHKQDPKQIAMQAVHTLSLEGR